MLIGPNRRTRLHADAVVQFQSAQGFTKGGVISKQASEMQRQLEEMHAKVTDRGVVMTLQGSSLTTAVSSSEVRVSGARITQADLVATNGIVHGIDASFCPRTGSCWRPLRNDRLSLSTFMH